MSTTQPHQLNAGAIKVRLEQAQAAIVRALRDGDTGALPELVAARQADIRALADHVKADPSLKPWAREYLVTDREILSEAMTARDDAAARLRDLQHNKSVHRAYLSGGVRR